MRLLELLAPAKNLSCAIAAIDHGADAVYIGANRFGARAAAGNSVEDIKKLCDYAHQYGAKVYVTVNTIIYEKELDATQQLIIDLSQAGVDALLVQDMATLQMRKIALDKVGYAPVLHASTQCDTRTVEKVKWLRSLGFDRAVLARELSLVEISKIHEAVPDIELEVFVHGALCVSYSGQCYASQHLLGRSANRGECAQVCRMKYDLIDANGDTVVKGRYLMSMKDMCQIDHLEELADAGASSFKIEGRLKDEDYVKNVVSAYSQRLDAIIKKRPADYRRSSWGRVEYGFEPSLNKTFNRGYTNYFLNWNDSSVDRHKTRPLHLSTMFTPKALGEFVGTVRVIKNNYFEVSVPFSGKKGNVFSNGDGLCFVNPDGELEGFRVNRAEGNKLFPFHMPKGLQSGLSLYRNNDVAFEKVLAADTTRRILPVDMSFGATSDGFNLTVSLAGEGLVPSRNGRKTDNSIPGGHKALPCKVVVDADFEHQQAKKPQGDNIRKQLSKLGGTIFEAANITIQDGAEDLFIPSSILASMRREAIEKLIGKLLEYNRLQLAATNREDVPNLSQRNYESATQQDSTSTPKVEYWSSEYKRYPYLFNVANHMAKEFYDKHGIDITQPAFEVKEPKESIVMQCRYCIRYELGYCVKRGGKKPTWKEPLTLRLDDGHRFRLDFRCDECQMNLVVRD